ncbi:MAG: biotin transporter BioY [Candidatus Izimaplasma sp.]|nr:biotin transporter BioY [Candidatus Izimaplasma bacterium]
MNLTVKEISLVAIFPALMAATAGISIPLGSLPSISLQTMFVFLAALLLGPKLGSISMIIYLIMGAIGLPVFSNYRGGISVLFSGSGGFIFGFIISAVFIGFMKNIKFINKNYWYVFGILVIGNILIYMCGASYISYITNTTIISVLAVFIPYFIGDFGKILVVLYVYSRIRHQITYEPS